MGAVRHRYGAHPPRRSDPPQIGAVTLAKDALQPTGDATGGKRKRPQAKRHRHPSASRYLMRARGRVGSTPLRKAMEVMPISKSALTSAIGEPNQSGRPMQRPCGSPRLGSALARCIGREASNEPEMCDRPRPRLVGRVGPRGRACKRARLCIGIIIVP